jgi:DNA-binding IclR family transcriptional regulator
MQAIQRTFAVLRSLADAHGSAPVGEVALATGLPKSTVSRLLTALESEGLVERVGSGGRYAIGPGLAALAGNVSVVGAVRELCRPHLRDLVEATGEAAGIVEPDGPRRVLYTDQIDGPGPVLTRDWTGSRFPYHTVAGGYAMMATWPDDRIEAYVDRGLERHSAVTATTIDEVMARIETTRRTGYAWTLGDFSEDIHGVGAAIIGKDGRAVAALSVYGPAYRFPGDVDAETVGRRLLEAASMVGRRLRSH